MLAKTIRYAAFIVIAVVLGNASPSDGGTVEAQKMNSQPSEVLRFASLSPQELRFLVGVFTTYLRLRDGVKASTDNTVQNKMLDRYLTDFAAVRLQNLSLLAESSVPCQRFLNLYNNTGLQLALHYSRYLREQGLAPDTKTNIDARLHILGLFEAAQLSLLIMHSEGGRSDLDPERTSTCATQGERTAWADSILRTHVSLQELQSAVFGQAPSDVPNPLLSAVTDLERRYELRSDMQRFGVLTLELTGSIALWERWMSPYLRGFVNGVKVAPVGRFSGFLATGAFAMGWVAVDSLLNDHLPFLQPDTEVSDPQTLSSWERLVTLGERFVATRLNSPPLYLAYLKMMEELRAQQIQGFLLENKDLFVQTEQAYGSVDTGLSKLKEVYDHEQFIHPHDPDPGVEPTLRAGGGDH